VSRADAEQDETDARRSTGKQPESRPGSSCALRGFFQLDANEIKVPGHNNIKVMILCLLKTGILSFLHGGWGL